MTAKNIDLVESSDTLVIDNGPGALLKKARLEAGLTHDDIASRLRLRVCVIKAIENDDFAPMAGNVFIRGYLRGYAKIVNVDANAVVAAFDCLAGSDETNDTGIWQSRAPVIKKERPARWIAYIIASSLLVLAVLGWQAKRKVSQPEQQLVSKEMNRFSLPPLNDLHPVTSLAKHKNGHIEGRQG